MKSKKEIEEMLKESTEVMRNNPWVAYRGDALWDLLMERILRLDKPRDKFYKFMKNHIHRGVVGIPIEVKIKFSTIGDDICIRCYKCNKEIELELWEYF